MKTCFKCLVEKPLSDFYAHPKMADGYLNKCKECTKADVKKRYDDNPEAMREYDRSRNQLPHRVEARKQYAVTPKGKEAIARAHHKYREQNPLKKAAHIILGNAVRDKRVIKSYVCELCGKGGRIHGHHADYSKPLEVQWLCPKCHTDVHKIT